MQPHLPFFPPIMVHNLNIVKEATSACVGLFWFSRDYKSIEMIKELKEVSEADISLGSRIGPEGYHIYYEPTSISPRGRVVFKNGKFIIYIGEDCPEDSITLVKETFNLKNYENQTKVKRDKHWNWVGNKK